MARDRQLSKGESSASNQGRSLSETNSSRPLQIIKHRLILMESGDETPNDVHLRISANQGTY